MKSDFESQQKIFFSCAAVSGFLVVSLGAFAAHALSPQIPPESRELLQTGIKYQMFHTLVLGLIALIKEDSFQSWTSAAGWFFIAGMILFSGSLYALAFSGARIWGAVTPLGGICFLVGWVILFFGNQKNRS